MPQYKIMRRQKKPGTNELKIATGSVGFPRRKYRTTLPINWRDHVIIETPLHAPFNRILNNCKNMASGRIIAG